MGEPKFTPGPWRSIDDLPPYEKRPIRQWVHVEGVREHSGSVWARSIIGEAVIRPEGADDERQGYRASDIEALEQRGDMDPGTGLVAHWMPVQFPPLPGRHEAALAQAIRETR